MIKKRSETSSPRDPLRLVVDPGRIDLLDLRRVVAGPVAVTVPTERMADVVTAHQVVRRHLENGVVDYGINTGFGLLANRRIEPDQLAALQRRLVLSHSAGTGPLLDDVTVRLILVLKLISLARGYSGVSPAVIEALSRLVTHEVYPSIPAKGSVGASGDLAPLAHLAAALIGVGTVRYRGQVLDAREGLAAAGVEPLELGPKEGLALINGTQVSTALTLRGLFACEDLLATAVVAGALSVDAVRGSDVPFDPRIHAARGQIGQAILAAAYRHLLAGSSIRESHRDCERVQDPYSLRCQPQVMGACFDLMSFAARTLEIEANAVTDNPLICPDSGEILSGGNFHAEPVAMAADILALALAEIGALSERRTALLVDSHLSGLPPFLVRDCGLNSGFMAAQVTAAALASENKSLAHPASVDSLPTSANQEDHVSMATFAGRRLLDMADNVAGIVAIELLAAAQGIDFHDPLKTSPLLQEPLARLRERVPRYDEDRFFAHDIEAAKDLVESGFFYQFLERQLPADELPLISSARPTLEALGGQLA